MQGHSLRTCRHVAIDHVTGVTRINVESTSRQPKPRLCDTIGLPDRRTQTDHLVYVREVFTKSFWQGVKKTFYMALEGLPSQDNASKAQAEDNPKDSPTLEIPSAKSETSEQIRPR